MVVPIIMQGPGTAKQKLQTSPELNGNGVLDGVRVHHPSKSGSTSFSRDPGFQVISGFT